MKKILLFMLITIAYSLEAQVLIDDTATPNTEPDASAVLELRSEDKGLLLPRLSTAPSNPVDGLIYFDTSGKCFRAYSNNSWQTLGAECVSPNTPPVASSPQIVDADGNVLTQIQEGQTVTASYTYTDADGDAESGSVIQWNSDLSATPSFPLSIGTNSTTYTATASDVGSFIGFCVTPNDGTDAGTEACTTPYIEVVAAPEPNGRINEFHYDNAGGDTGEFIEVRLTNAEAGAVSEYTVEIVNDDGSTNSSHTLSTFTLGSDNGTYTYYYKDIAAIPNADKGIKLNQNGTTIDFISYETEITGATLVRNQAGVALSQGGSDPIGSSLQREESANYWYATDGFNTKGEQNSDTQVTNPTVEFSEATATILEDGATSYTVTVNLTNPGQEDVEVTINTTENNAVVGTDYTTTLSSPLTITAGSTTATFTITAIDDTDEDAGESITFTITGVSSNTETPAIGNTNSIVVSITDNDMTTPTSCKSDLIISEYVEGSSSNKYIEIYNGTGDAVDLSAYSLVQYNNGSTTPSYEATLSGSLPDDSVIVYRNTSATIYSDPTSTLSNNSVMSFNGNDPVALVKGGATIDIVGGPIGSSSNFAKDKTLSRSSTAQPNATFDASEWSESSQDTVTGLGSYTCTN